MEVKVDIRRLQYLNDRIAQVTDALNQVRLSVHGLQPALGFSPSQFGVQPPPGFPQFPFGAGPIGGIQHTPYATLPSPVPFGPFAWPTGFQPPMVGGLGLQHTAYGAYPPYVAPGVPGIGGIQGVAQAGWGSPAGLPFVNGGLFHSPSDLMEQRLGEQRAVDPSRILQTFPLCLIPLSSTPTW